MRILFTALALLLSAQQSFGAICSRTLTFADGAVLTAAQLNAEFNAITNCANSLSDSNISTSASILPSKLNSTIAGDGIARDGSTGVLSVGVDNTSIEISSDTLSVKDSGITAAKIATDAVITAKILNSNVTTAKIADGAITAAKLDPNISANLTNLRDSYQIYTSGSGTYLKPYKFLITSGSATVGATYTNNAQTFTVRATIASDTELVATSSGDPASSGTLTKTSGTGDSTITFSLFKRPSMIDVESVGAGGGGAGTSTNGGSGGNTNFGFPIVEAGGGSGGTTGGLGGDGGSTTTSGTAAIFIKHRGGPGFGDGNGGASIYGGAGNVSTSFKTASTNSGSGGAGAASSRGGGGGGGHVRAIFLNPASSYTYTIGAGGSSGSGGSAGDGADGYLVIKEKY